MNVFDQTLLAGLNQWARHSWMLDRTVQYLSGAHLLKGGVVVAVLWWAWFREGAGQDLARRRVIVTVTASMAALLIGKLCQLAFPSRARPMHIPDLGLVLPFGVPPTLMRDWSSFPSDHAILFIGLSTGLWFVSRRAGLLVLGYSLLLVLLPRVYLLLHHPTDLLGGAAIGAGVVYAGQRLLVQRRGVDLLMGWIQRHPQSAYPVLFLVSFQVAVLFDDVRALGSAIAKAFGPHTG